MRHLHIINTLNSVSGLGWDTTAGRLHSSSSNLSLFLYATHPKVVFDIYSIFIAFFLCCSCWCSFTTLTCRKHKNNESVWNHFIFDIVFKTNQLELDQATNNLINNSGNQHLAPHKKAAVAMATSRTSHTLSRWSLEHLLLPAWISWSLHLVFGCKYTHLQIKQPEIKTNFHLYLSLSLASFMTTMLVALVNLLVITTTTPKPNLYLFSFFTNLGVDWHLGMMGESFVYLFLV